MFQGSHPDQSSKVMELVGLKTESLPDDSTSSTALIPDAELEPFTQDDIVRTEERKGGRKPVCNIFFAAPPDAIIQALHCFSHTFSLPRDSLYSFVSLHWRDLSTFHSRYAPPPVNESSTANRSKLPFANTAPSTFTNWRKSSSATGRSCRVCSKDTAVRQTTV